MVANDPAPKESSDRLLRAARDEFAVRGFAGASLQAIVRKCGVTKGALYHHFNGKADLFEAVVEFEVKRLAHRFEQGLVGQPNPWQAAASGVRAYLLAAADPGTLRILLLDGPSNLGSEHVWNIQSRHVVATLRKLLRQLALARSLRALDPEGEEMAARLLLGALAAGASHIAASGTSGVASLVERSILRLIRGVVVRDVGDA